MISDGPRQRGGSAGPAPGMVADFLEGERTIVEGDLVDPADERPVDRDRCRGSAVNRPRTS